jgi:hypothetical protein
MPQAHPVCTRSTSCRCSTTTRRPLRKRAHVRLQTSGELTFMNIPIEESVRFTEARLVTARNVVVPL